MTKLRIVLLFGIEYRHHFSAILVRHHLRVNLALLSYLELPPDQASADVLQNLQRFATTGCTREPVVYIVIVCVRVNPGVHGRPSWIW